MNHQGLCHKPVSPEISAENQPFHGVGLDVSRSFHSFVHEVMAESLCPLLLHSPVSYLWLWTRILRFVVKRLAPINHVTDGVVSKLEIMDGPRACVLNLLYHVH
jgi:hypothetical protein